jgi:hypothetical protein
MTTRVHGGVESGAWFSSKSVKFVSLANAGFLAAEEGVADSTLEQAVELVQRISTIAIMQVEDGVALHLCLDYAAGDLADLQADMDALMGSAVTITEGEFRVA